MSTTTTPVINCPINSTLGLDGPAGIPPPGQCPNYTDPYSLRPRQIALTVISTTVLTFLLVARLYTFFVKNFSRNKSMVWEILEEVSSILVWALLIVFQVMCTALTETSMGRHIWDVSLASAIHMTRLINIAELMYPLMIFFSKFIILSQFLRIFSPNSKGFMYWGCHTLIWVNLMFYTSVFFLVLFQCVPRQKIWIPTTEGRCLNSQAVFISTGSFNLGSDIVILLLPLKAIWGLNMRKKQKLQVSAIFSTGLFACIASAVRLYYSVEFLTSSDATFVLENVGLWSQTEVTTVAVCAALPVLSQFWKLLRKNKPNSDYNQYPSRSKKSGLSWSNKEDDEQVLNRSYIPLESKTKPMGSRSDGGSEHDIQPPHASSNFPFDNGIVKTTRIETSTSTMQ